MKNWIAQHGVITALGIYYTLSAAIGALPHPDDKSGKFYLWFYNFTQMLAANFSRFVSQKTQFPAADPQVKPQ